MIIPLTRTTILAALRAALEPMPHVQAMWEGGAAAFGRVDEWSDIDVQIAVDDELVAGMFPVIERTLTALSPITIKHVIPQPAWHGHEQVFYRLQDTSPYLIVDMVVMKTSAQNRFLESEIHGQALVHFDKIHFVQAKPLERARWAEMLRARVASLRTTFDIFQVLTTKEIQRHNDIEALTFYYSFTVRPLVELLRIQHAPFRYNFHSRYIAYDLPADIVSRLEPLFFIANGAEIGAKRELAEQWFNTLMSQICIE